MPVDESRVILAYLQKVPVVCPSCRGGIFRPQTACCPSCGRAVTLEGVWRTRRPLETYDESDIPDETASYVRQWLRIATGSNGPEALAVILREHDYPCYRCGYNLRGVRDARCPECGRDVRETDLFPMFDPGYVVEHDGQGVFTPGITLVIGVLAAPALLVAPFVSPVLFIAWLVAIGALVGVIVLVRRRTKRRLRARARPDPSAPPAPS